MIIVTISIIFPLYILHYYFFLVFSLTACSIILSISVGSLTLLFVSSNDTIFSSFTGSVITSSCLFQTGFVCHWLHRLLLLYYSLFLLLPFLWKFFLFHLKFHSLNVCKSSSKKIFLISSIFCLNNSDLASISYYIRSFHL